MPQDVATQWNSTYDMLNFTLEFQDAPDAITSDNEMKLQKYEMDKEEWEIAQQLRNVLKVSLSLANLIQFNLKCCLLGLQRCDLVFLMRWDPESGNCHSCYGPY